MWDSISMQKDSKLQRRPVSKSGVIPRPVIEPELRREPIRPPQLQDNIDINGSTTGVIHVVQEGDDKSAIGDDDAAEGS